MYKESETAPFQRTAGRSAIRTSSGAPSATALHDVLSRTGNELSRFDFAHLEDLGDLPVWMVERFPKDIRSSLGRSKLFEKQEHRELQRLSELRAQRWIRAGVHRVRKLNPGPQCDQWAAIASPRYAPSPRLLPHFSIR